ncbi:venom serine carboxypeptidase-like [Coccinella septempunctata]|uniref:venom serine carboxypeptidase-like n=1 Tax=Coccinella septempunctata TaxID=41139 RepID=UPI001D05EA88|nr:venom serine carboxypeptidase-like [Coccinella septempunctata]
MRTLTLLVLCCLTAVQCCHKKRETSSSEVSDVNDETNVAVKSKEPLFLTPYIEQGFIEEGRRAAEVNSELFLNTTSYSGFFTVNYTYNKNLFGWFIPSKNPDDPIMLWLQGGPGLTSMFGLFAEMGPFKIENDTLELRETSWTNAHSILYIDNPVGTGYSFTEEKGLARDEVQVAEELYEALRQFFLLFPEIRQNEFFVAGESYAGKYVPVIAHAIFKKNENLPDSFKINLKGVIIGNGWLDPVNQMDIGEYAFQHGLVDINTKTTMDQYRDESIVLLRQGKFVESTLVQRKISSLLKNASGYENMYNYLYPGKQQTEAIMTNFVQKPEVRTAIHVGNLTFNPDEPVDTALLGDVMISVADKLIDLLANLRVLIYSGQLDLAVPYPTTVNYLLNLKFDSAEEYRVATRDIWYRDGGIAGYVKRAGNLTEVMVRNAGHLVPSDQPEVAFDLIRAFTRNENITISI